MPGYITPEMIIDAWKGESVCAYLDSNDDINPYSQSSILGFEPFLRIIYKNDIVSLIWDDGNKNFSTDLWATMRDILADYQIFDSFSSELPAGAAIGYMSYDLGMEIEGALSSAKPGFGWPLLEFAFYDLLFCFDHKGKTNLVISTGLPCRDMNKRWKRAGERLRYALNKLYSYININKYKETYSGSCPKNSFNCRLRSNFDTVSYIEAIQKIKSYISAGDVYQINLSQSFAGSIAAEGLSIYKHIRRFNRVPFGAYLRFDEREILCFSMERFLRMQGDKIETRPIKGTRPRGKNNEEDCRLSLELFKSPKDRAELVMIVDMERNDLGKVCRPGTVRVKRLFEVEKYSTVFHLVSTIRGELDEGADQLDCIKACLPGGSITGAPKIRAMQIIDELEGIKRGVYCGTIGYLGFNRISDFNIPIRTILKERDNIRFNTGGGILYDSDPESEYQETLHKVRSFLDCFAGY